MLEHSGSNISMVTKSDASLIWVTDHRRYAAADTCRPGKQTHAMTQHDIETNVQSLPYLLHHHHRILSTNQLLIQQELPTGTQPGGELFGGSMVLFLMFGPPKEEGVPRI